MKEIVRIRQSAWIKPLTVVALLTGVITTGWSQQFASARLTSAEPTDHVFVTYQNRSGAGQVRSLAKVLADLERRHQVIFDFDNDVVKAKFVNAAVADKQAGSLEKILTELLTPLDLAFEKYSSRSYLIYSKTARNRAKSGTDKSAAEARALPVSVESSVVAAPVGMLAALTTRAVTFQAPADRTVTGTITDGATNGGLPGVNVLVKGTSIGTTTDKDGNFRLNVPDGRNTLVLSYIGYVTQEVNITGRSTITLTMSPDDRSINEVVVVGYGTQKRADLTGAVASVKATDLRNLPATDVATSLQGRVPGALVQQSDGSPGAASSIIIRGPASINGSSQPLYVVDGVPQGNPGYNFNIQDVESIEVLKDASAAAIYGAQAGGGVVLITTKKGKAGKLQVGFSSNVGIRNVFNLPQQLRRDQYIPAKQAFGYDVVDLYGPQSGWANLPDTRWFDEVFRQGSEENYQLSVAGGNDKSHYYLSGNYNKINGTRIGNWLEKYSFRVNSDHQVGKRLKFTQTLLATYQNGSPNQNANQGPLSFRNTPVMPVYDPTNPLGGWGRAPRGFQGGNDVQAAIGNYRNSNGYEFYASGALDYEIANGLTARALFGTRFNTNQYYQYNPPFDIGTSLNRVDVVQKSMGRGQDFVATYTLNYRKAFGKHAISALAGYEARRNEFANMNFTNQNGLVPFAQNANLFNNVNLAQAGFDQNDVENRILSQFGRVEYNFADKYLLTVNVRRDGFGSKFGPNYRFGVFPGVSAGWKISDEAFMKNIPYLTLLKLRAGYGSLGNATQDNFAFFGGYGAGFSYDFSTNGTVNRQSGITLQTKLPNPDIRWESVNSTNIGLDAGLFANRLTVNLDYYLRNTNNMLYNIGLPPSAGLGGSVPANVGQLRNTGFEFVLDWRDKKGDFSYGVALNGAFNRNKLLSLDPSLGSRAFIPSGNPATDGYRDGIVSRSAPGFPIGQFFGYQVLGIYQNNAAATENRPTVSGYTPQAGDLIYQDRNGDGIITEDDKTFIGNPWPKLTYGINLTAGWKGFDVRAFFSGVYGNQIYNAFETLTHIFFSDYNTTANIFNTSGFNRNPTTGQPIVQGLPSNGVTNVPRTGTLDDLDKNGNWLFVSSYHVQPGSYLRMRNLQIGYTFPNVVVNKLRMSSLRVFVMGDNLFTITRYKGINPDIPPQDNSPRQLGIDASSFRYPISRLMSIGINADF